MIKVDKYIYTCHRNTVSSNHNKTSKSAPHTIQIYKWQLKTREKINLRYVYYTYTYV